MHSAPKILIVEDSESLAAMYQEYLRIGQYAVSHTATGTEAKEKILAQLPDVILLDLKLPDISGQDILQWLKEQRLSCQTIVMTAHGSVDVAVEVMQLGATDFLQKPFDATRLQTTLENVLEKGRLTELVRDLQNTYGRDHYQGFIGSSLPMQAVYKTIDAVAPSKATVFITGESGTGKEVCAEAIHKQGPLAKSAFIALNCAAIPKDLMESEIFGHVKGAFTGAVAERKGAALQADGGTLFLDEIGEMDLDLQTKLLRFIQTGIVKKVGSSKEEKVDVRIVCATNRNPLEEIEQGRFREDLYYRLNVVPIHLSPLRERGEDISLLANHFLCIAVKEEGKDFHSLSPEVDIILSAYEWPGNIRQLQNVIRNIVVLHNDEIVKLEHLPPPLNTVDPMENVLQQPNQYQDQHQQKGSFSEFDVTKHKNFTRGAECEVNSEFYTESDIRPLALVERETIEKAIKICGDNIPKAAALLEVSPSTIYRKKQNW